MKIIGSTEIGYLISATEEEVKQICKATVGDVKEINVGLKLPALDYASTLRKLKKLSSSYDLTQVKKHSQSMVKSIEKLDEELNLLKEVHTNENS